MYLINTQTLQLRHVINEETVQYAILSHRWEEDEVLFEDMNDINTCIKAGVKKLKAFCNLLRQKGYEYGWVDTCCIDKKSSAELSEAINSMFRYYQSAAICFVYMCDVDVSWLDAGYVMHFMDSVWFTRCWTLQELLAPRFCDFYNKNWEFLDSKQNLIGFIWQTTLIDRDALRGKTLSDYSIAERMAWASRRKATRNEDVAYSLMGIFEINMPMLYGEGHRAFERLQEEILRYSDDETLFAWQLDGEEPLRSTKGLLAPSPACFKDCINLKSMQLYERSTGFTLTNRGITAELVLHRLSELKCAHDSFHDHSLEFLCILNAAFRTEGLPDMFVGMYLQQKHVTKDEYSMSTIRPHLWKGTLDQVLDIEELQPRKINVRHKGGKTAFAPTQVHILDTSKILEKSYVAGLQMHKDAKIVWGGGAYSRLPGTFGPYCSMALFPNSESGRLTLFMQLAILEGGIPACIIANNTKDTFEELEFKFSSCENIVWVPTPKFFDDNLWDIEKAWSRIRQFDPGVAAFKGVPNQSALFDFSHSHIVQEVYGPDVSFKVKFTLDAQCHRMTWLADILLNDTSNQVTASEPSKAMQYLNGVTSFFK